MVGTASLGGVVAVANGRCGIPRNQVRGRLRHASGHRSHPRPESGRRPLGRVWGWGKRDGSPQGSGRGSQRPPCGVLPGGTERPFKQAQEGGDPESKQGTEAPLCLTGRQPLLALRQRQATLRSGPRASLRQGPQPPQAAPRDDLAGRPAHPKGRRDLKGPVVARGNQRSSPSRALAVD